MHGRALRVKGRAVSVRALDTVLSRQDTFKYLEELATGSPQVKVDAARALKSLAFNANAEYKEGLLKGGVPRLLMVMVSEAHSTSALEQATSCMYSMAREHMESKMALVKAGALRVLATTLLVHQVRPDPARAHARRRPRPRRSGAPRAGRRRRAW